MCNEPINTTCRFWTKKNIIRAVWIIIAAICTAIFLYLFIYLSYTISGLVSELGRAYAESGEYGTEDFIRSFQKFITTDSIILSMICVLYASFSVLVTEKLIALFRHPKVERGEDVPRR